MITKDNKKRSELRELAGEAWNYHLNNNYDHELYTERLYRTMNSKSLLLRAPLMLQ